MPRGPESHWPEGRRGELRGHAAPAELTAYAYGTEDGQVIVFVTAV
jgi:hypothetical protein